MKLNTRDSVLVFVASILPAVVLLPVILSPVPVYLTNPAVEVAGYFQSLAILREPFASYTYLTIQESYAALHLHSVVSAPLLALGVQQAGRVVSVLSTIFAALLLSSIAFRLEGRRAALLAPVLLWIHPITVRISDRWFPETLGIVLTTAAVYLLIRYLDEGRERWYYLSLAVVAIAVSNHMWEASILLPMVTLLVYHEKYRKAAGAVAVTGAAIASVWALTLLQPSGASTYTFFGVHNDPLIFLDLSWWNYITKFPTHPLQIARTFTMPLAIAGIGWAGWRAYTTNERKYFLLSSWLASGLSIPVLLHSMSHIYYLWALLAPLALLGATVIGGNLPKTLPAVRSTDMGRIVAIVLLLFAVQYGLFFETAVFAGTAVPVLSDIDSSATTSPNQVAEGEAVEAGQQLQSFDIQQADSVTFVGPWVQENATRWQGATPATRVLIYGKVHGKEARNLYSKGSSSFVENKSQIEDCKAYVEKDGKEVHVGSCEDVGE